MRVNWFPNTATLKRRATQKILLASALLLFGTFVGVYWLVHEESKTRQSEITGRANWIAYAFEEEVNTAFTFADTYLKMLRDIYEEDRSVSELKKHLLTAPLEESHFSHVTLINREGRPVYNSKYPINPKSNAFDRPYFQHFVETNSEELYISLPHKGRNSNKSVIRAVRRINDEFGNFDGVMFVAIDADRLVKFFRELDLGEDSSATLVGLDKRIRARSHYGRLGPGQDISGSQLWKHIEESPIGTYQQTSIVDSIERIYSYRQLRHYPLVVAIGVPLNFYGQASDDIRFIALGFGTLGAIIVILLTYLAIRESENAFRLAKSNAAKDQFLGHMSHELRTPLNSIIGFSDMISNQLLGQCNVTKYVEYGKDIKFAGSHLLTIINDILDLTKIEAGERKTSPEWLCLRELLEEANSIGGFKVSKSGLKLRTTMVEGVPRLWADRIMVRQIFINLIGNAIKFSDDNGTVDISVVFNPHTGIVITISDNGPGIPREDIKRVLRPFEQARASVLTSAAGTGLGLPLASLLTELNGGFLELHSDFGNGTVVEIHFPAALTDHQKDGIEMGSAAAEDERAA